MGTLFFALLGILVEAIVIYSFIEGKLPTRFSPIREEESPFFFYIGLAIMALFGLSLIFPNYYERSKMKLKNIFSGEK